MDEFERCLLVKNEVFVYKIGPRQSAKGFRAADWNLTAPDWTGRMRLMQKAKSVKLKLEDKGSGELFAACPIDTYPGTAVEAVTDSSRYFVIKIVDDGGRSAYIGMGFADRSDSFDLNVALQDHFKALKKEDEISKEEEKPFPDLNLGFKEGQTIKVNINIPKGDKARTKKGGGSLGGGLLPPPPGGVTKPPSATPLTASPGPLLAAAPGPANLTPASSPTDANKPVIGSSSLDLLCDLSPLSIGATTPVLAQPASNSNPVPGKDDPWGDFAAADNIQSNSGGNWVQF